MKKKKVNEFKQKREEICSRKTSKRQNNCQTLKEPKNQAATTTQQIFQCSKPQKQKQTKKPS